MLHQIGIVKLLALVTTGGIGAFQGVPLWYRLCFARFALNRGIWCNMRAREMLRATLLALGVTCSISAHADLELVCPCAFASAGPTSATLTAGIANTGDSTSGNLRIRAISMTSPDDFSDASTLSHAYYAEPLASGFSFAVDTAVETGFVAVTGQYHVVLRLEEETGGDWQQQDMVRLEPDIGLDEIGGESSGSSSEDARGALYFDGTATATVTDGSVTISLPAITNSSASFVSGDLVVTLGHYETAEVFGQSFFSAAELELGVGVGPFESITASETTVPISPAGEGFDYMHLTVKDPSLAFPVLLWQTVQTPDGVPLTFREFSVTSVDTLTDTDTDGVSDFNEGLSGSDPADSDSVPGQSTIDVMALYTPGVTTLYAGEPEARIIQELEFGNAALASSQVDAVLRLVYTAEVDYDEVVDNHTAFNAVQDQTGVFVGLDTLRESVGADLVLLLRPEIPDTTNCGVGTLSAVGEEGDLAMTDRSSIVAVVFAECRDRTTIHEFGHNMGLAHSVRDDTSNQGTFAWSRGHGVDSEFCTIMSDFRNFPGCEDLDVFSNPNTLCNGLACGVDRLDESLGADAALTINTVRFLMADLSPDPPDTDLDGLIDFEDSDDDNDGIPDEVDPFPLEAATGGAATDFNGDGLSDILWRNTADGRNIIWSMNGGDRTSATLIQTIPEPWSLGGQGDFDGDGTTDLLWRNADDGRNLMWFFQNGSRSSSALAPSVTDLTRTIAATPDIDGDGKSDILWRLSDGRNIVWFMDGASRRDALLLHSITDVWELGGAGDFDGDGSDDLLWHNTEDDRNIVWLMGLSGRLQAKLIHNSPLQLAGIADFDADGNDDILWRDTATGRNILWFMAAGERADFALLPSVVDTTWHVAALKDFDGNGTADIHWRTDDGRNILWFMSGATRTGAALTFSVTNSEWISVDGCLPGCAVGGAPAPQIASARRLLSVPAAPAPELPLFSVVGDFSGDGLDDILMTFADDVDESGNRTQPRIRVFVQSGDLRLSEATDRVMDEALGGTAADSVFVDDFDGDGFPDILGTSLGSAGQILDRYMNDGTGRFFIVSTEIAAEFPAIYLPIDLGGDGQTDIVAITWSEEEGITFEAIAATAKPSFR